MIVDDSEEDRTVVKDWLSKNDDYTYTFEEAESVEDGIAIYSERVFDCIILDHSFPIDNAVGFLQKTVGNDRIKFPAPVIVITGQGNEKVAVDAVKAGAQNYISKKELASAAQSNHRLLDEAISEFRHNRELKKSHNERDRLLAKLKKKTRELTRAKAEADTANVAKSAFLANMSHEIRSPLTAIIGFTDLLMNSGVAEYDKPYLYETINKNGKHLLSVINDILDLSKVEAGKVALTYSKFDVRNLVEDVADSFRKGFEAKGVKLRIFYSTRAVCEIQSDPTRVRQILTNLLANSLKFTLHGDVSLAVQGCADEGPAEEISIIVSDTGVGMTRAETKKIFRRFVQANDEVGTRFGGTGLGLALSKNLASLIGGDLKLISSEEGVGSVFKLRLPFNPPDISTVLHVQSAGSSLGVSLKGLRILVADDSFDNQFLIRRYLERAGAHVACVDDGQELIEAERESDYDIIVADVKMPVMDGHEAGRILRARGVTIPIIGLSASAMPDDIARSSAAGFNDQLSKPINADELIRSIYNLTAVHRRNTGDERGSGSPEI